MLFRSLEVIPRTRMRQRSWWNHRQTVLDRTNRRRDMLAESRCLCEGCQHCCSAATRALEETHLVRIRHPLEPALDRAAQLRSSILVDDNRRDVLGSCERLERHGAPELNGGRAELHDRLLSSEKDGRRRLGREKRRRRGGGDLEDGETFGEDLNGVRGDCDSEIISKERRSEEWGDALER